MNYVSNKINRIIAIVFIALAFTSCEKFLEEKPDKSAATISRIADLMALLNDYARINKTNVNLSLSGADDFEITSSAYGNISLVSRNTYLWKSDVNVANSWSECYRAVAIANTVLQELERVSDGTMVTRNELKGQALFTRACALFNLSQQYCKPFGNTSSTDLGLPLRLTPNLEEKIFRSTVAETYERILTDLKQAEVLMPERGKTINLPGSLAACGLLARVYLSMADYKNAQTYADKYLQRSPELMDYNDFINASPAFTSNNVECNYLFWIDDSPIAGVYPVLIKPELFSSYEQDDLRRSVFFKTNADGSHSFKGSYYGDFWDEASFIAVATDEVYLIRAECRVRANDIAGGMDDLNKLLVKRYKSGVFVPLAAASKEQAVNIIISERRKELVLRGTRWSDLRRLNLEGANISLTRVINGVTYTLPANDKRWVWLIPQEVISLSGIQQNQ